MLPDTEIDRILVAASVAILVVSVVLGLSYFVVFDDPEPPLGTNGEEITNMKILQETHKAHLRETGYEVDYAYVETNKTGERQSSAKTQVNYRYNGDDRAVSHQTNSQDGVVEINSYQYHLFDKETKYIRDSASLDPEYDVKQQSVDPFVGLVDIELIIGLSDTEFRGYTEDRQGLVYNVSASKEDDKLLNFDYDGVITVDEKGYIRSLDIEGTSEEIDTTYAMSVSNVGSTTVEEPQWVDKAKEQTDQEEQDENTGTENDSDTDEDKNEQEEDKPTPDAS